MTDENTPPRRVSPADVIVRRAARQLVAPMQDRVGQWQVDAVKLDTMLQRAAGSGGDVAPLRQAVLDLREAVKAEAALFDAQVVSAPEAVRGHSRVADARLVLQRLEARLQQTLDGLPKGKGG